MVIEFDIHWNAITEYPRMDSSQYFQNFQGQESPSPFTSVPPVINIAPLPAPDSELGSDFMAGSVGSVNLPSEPEPTSLDEQEQEESDQRTEAVDTAPEYSTVTDSDLQASGSDFHIGMEVDVEEEDADSNAFSPESGSACESGSGSALMEGESPEYVEYEVDADEGVGDSDEGQEEGSFASCEELDNGEEGEMDLVDVAGSGESGTSGSQSEGSDEEGEDKSMNEAASEESGSPSGTGENGSDSDSEMADDEEESQAEDEDEEATEAEPEAAGLFMQSSVLDQMQGFESAFPDALTNHFLHSAGFDSSDPRITHLVSLAAQKYLTDILKGAHTICKAKATASAAVASCANGGEPEDSPLPTTLTMEDLEAAAKERGIEMPKQFP